MVTPMVTATDTETPSFITTAQAAERLACSTGTVRNLLDAGELRGIKVGRNMRVELASLRDYLRRSSITPAPRVQ